MRTNSTAVSADAPFPSGCKQEAGQRRYISKTVGTGCTPNRTGSECHLADRQIQSPPVAWISLRPALAQSGPQAPKPTGAASGDRHTACAWHREQPGRMASAGGAVPPRKVSFLFRREGIGVGTCRNAEVVLGGGLQSNAEGQRRSSGCPGPHASPLPPHQCSCTLPSHPHAALRRGECPGFIQGRTAAVDRFQGLNHLLVRGSCAGQQYAALGRNPPLPVGCQQHFRLSASSYSAMFSVTSCVLPAAGPQLRKRSRI